MSQRRYGPVQGAGTVVVEKDAEKQIEKGTLGTTVHVGVLERGPVNKLFRNATKSEFLRRAGSYIDESLVPDSAFSFYKLSRGAGELYHVRVTDGSEVQSEVTIFGRKESGINPEVMKVKAHNGGRWAGKKQSHFGLDFGIGGLTSITFDTGLTLLKDQLKGGKVSFSAMPGKAYTIISNDVAGVITVASDSDMAADYTASGSSDETWKVLLLNEDKELGIVIKDSLLDPTGMFGMEIYLNGESVLEYTDLSMDPNSKYYFEKYINDDENNDFVEVENLWSGSIIPEIRPANVFGQSSALTDTKLTMERVQALADGANVGNGTIGSYSFGGDAQEDVITVECVSLAPATFSYTSAKLGLIAGASPVAGTPFVAPNDFGVGFTITEGATVFAVGDKFTLYSKPLVQGSLIGGWLYPNVDTARRIKFKITANDYNSITVKPSDLMLAVATLGDNFRVEALSVLGGGYDGVANLLDADYLKVFDSATSTINNLFGMGKGLVKIACPGVTSTAVQKAGAEYAEARNYQFRYEVPSNIVTEEGAEQYINDTIGRNDFAVVEFPSYYHMTHPTKAGLKLVSATGAIHGREALVAKNYLGYHKAAAGIDVTISECIKLPIGDKTLDEEFLNPQGINVLKFKDGVCIIWGDRTLSIDPAWKWKHQREMMSYYENDMREKFDWIIFAINDEETERSAKSALRSYFEPEFKKRALRGEDFNDACTIKLDSEINTNATRANGDMFSEVSLRLADTVERFTITMSKMGIFETVG